MTLQKNIIHLHSASIPDNVPMFYTIGIVSLIQENNNIETGPWNFRVFMQFYLFW